MYLKPEHLAEKRYEKYKSALRPYDFFPEIQHLDFESLAESDRVFLQDFGIFNSELEEEMFMLRVRVPGGRVGAENFIQIAKMAERYDLTILLTARSGIQLHGIEAEDVLELFNAVNALPGLSTWQTFGDNVRNVVTDPYDGIGPSCEIESFPIIEKMHDFFLKNPELVGMLPRRISIGITGMRRNVWPLFSNDLFFGLAEKDGMKGFNVYMGGKNTEISQRADIFLPPEEVADFAAAVIEAFNRYGLREKRMKSRLFHMIEHYGMEQVKSFIAEFYGKGWTESGESLLIKERIPDRVELSDGRWGVRWHTEYGLVTPEEAMRAAEYAKTEGADVRIGIDQQLYLLGLPTPEVDLPKHDTAATVVACAGSEYCPFSYWSIKEEAHYLPAKRLEKDGIRVGFSGCLKGCGRHKHCDIGIVGLRNANFGDDDRSARIFLGGEISEGNAVTEVYLRSVPLENLNAIVSLLIDLYEASGLEDFETFSADVLKKFEPEFVEFYLLARLATGKAVPFDPKKCTETIAREFGPEAFVEIALMQGWKKASDALMKKMWFAKKVATVQHMDPTKRRIR